MSFIRQVQKKHNQYFISLPRIFVDHMSLKQGDHFMIHALNKQQLVLSLLDEALPQIQLEEKEVV